jgi:hypothetical protein
MLHTPRARAGIALVLALVGMIPRTMAQDRGLLVGELLPTSQQITPTAAPGSSFGPLLPIPSSPDLKAGQAVELAVSPDGSKLLILTSG